MENYEIKKTGAVDIGTQAILTISHGDSNYVSCKSKLCKRFTLQGICSTIEKNQLKPKGKSCEFPETKRR